MTTEEKEAMMLNSDRIFPLQGTQGKLLSFQRASSGVKNNSQVNVTPE